MRLRIAGIRIGLRIVLTALWLGLGLGFGAEPAAAQGFDLRGILGRGAEAESEPAKPSGPISVPRVPLQSLPSTFDPESAPTPDDYARVIGTRSEPMLGELGDAVTIFQGRLDRLIRRTPDAIDEISTTLATASPTGRGSYFVGVAIFAALLLVIGNAVAELYASFIARPIFVSLQRRDPQGYSGKLPVLAWRIALTAVGAALTLLVAAGVGLSFYDGHEATLLTVIVIFATYTAVALIDTIWRMALAPFLREYRLPNIGDREARRLYRWTAAVSSFAVGANAFCYWVEALGLPREIHVIVTIGLTLVTVVLLLTMVRGNRHTINRIILSGRSRAESSWISVAVTALWPPLVTLYLIGTWADLGFRMVMGIEAGPARLLVPYLTLIGGLTIYAVTIFGIERVFRRRHRIEAINQVARDRAAARAATEAETDARQLQAEMQTTHFGDSGADDDGDGDEEGSAIAVRAEKAAAVPAPAYGGMRTMEDLARRVASLFAIGVAAYALLRFWGGADIFERYVFLEALEDVIDIAFIGYIIFHTARIWMDQKIAEEVGDEPEEAAIMDGEGGGAGATRLATLLPLVRNAVLIIVATAILLVIATEIGVNVAPLFAGAGILGLAIGFGSQTLVRDILSGAFFLMDDAFRKGEYIDVGDVKGTVEKISLRSFQLRHHLGMLHTIPFGEIQFLTNFSRDWVMMKLPLRLTYDTDVERVRKLVKKLGLALLEDETIGEKFLAPLKSQGVIQMEDSAMIIRIKFMTRPGDQWVVRKRVYQEIRELFEREGIHFAHREVTVRIPGLPQDRELDENEQRIAGAAARSTLDVVEAGQLARAGGIDDR